MSFDLLLFEDALAAAGLRLRLFSPSRRTLFLVVAARSRTTEARRSVKRRISLSMTAQPRIDETRLEITLGQLRTSC